MFKNLTLLVITALVLITSGLNADSLGGSKKDMKVVPVEANKLYSSDIGGYYEEYDGYSEDIVSEPIDIKNKSLDAIIFVRLVKSNYRVGEPIKIQLKLKKSAYIYFWTVSRDGRGYLIVPNKYEKYNNRYKPNVLYVVPNKSSKFNLISDEAGVEHLFILATNKQISQKKIDEIFNQNNAFRFKDLVVAPKSDNLKYDICEKKVYINNR